MYTKEPVFEEIEVEGKKVYQWSYETPLGSRSGVSENRYEAMALMGYAGITDASTLITLLNERCAELQEKADKFDRLNEVARKDLATIEYILKTLNEHE